MPEKKEQLKLLLEFISTILKEEGNEWFHDELAILFSKKFKSEKDTGIKLSAVTIKELGSIDKYLEEGIVPIIDYNMISDQRLKFQLERDAIEMGKSRLSNYSEPISFKNFCKYAHFQSEGLINYYYQKVSNGKVDKAKKRIHTYNEKFKDKTGKDNLPYSSISSIPHSVKQYALFRELNLNNGHYSTLLNIGKIRNIEIHRSSEKAVNDYLKNFLRKEDYSSVYEAIIYLRSRIVNILRE